VGNSSVMTLPRGLEHLGYTPDSQVLVEELPSGQLLVTLAEKIRTRIRKIGRRVVAEDREALRILEAHDRRG
jgi:antitoxin component of MazEF toxin-antitoxin module